MKIALVGPGAMGCLFAVYLAEAGHEVRVLDHRPERAKLLSSQGLFVEGIRGEHHQRVPVSVLAEDVTDAELILVCVKSYHTREAITAVAPALNPQARVLTLQNGVGNIETLAEAVGLERVFGGVTSQGATVLAPGRVRHAGLGQTVIGAAVSAGQEEMLGRAAAALHQAGIETRIDNRVESLIWSKLMVNVGINALTALTRLRNGQLLDYAGIVSLMEKAVLEALAVAEALRIPLIHDDPVAQVKAVARATAGNVSSMLQDVLARRRTEIDSINGAIVEHGQRLELATPVNETLTMLVRTVESSYGAGL